MMTKMTKMDCKEVMTNMSCYIDRDGSEELRKVLSEHVADCRRCRVIFHTTGQMLGIVREAKPFEVPLAVSARLYSRLERILSDR